MIDQFDIIPVTRDGDPCHYAFCLPNRRAYESWPDFPSAARPEHGRAAAGRGLSPAQCRASALGEAVELACACAWGDEPLITASQDELGASALGPKELGGFSAQQMAEREAWNASPLGAIDWLPAPYDTSRPIAWVPGAYALGGPCFIPADHVLVGRREPGDPEAVAIATTAGCAAAATLQAARTRALLELVERDAVGQWWYRRLRRPAIGIAALDLPDPVLRYLGDRKRQTLMLDLTTEFGVPVIAGCSFLPDGSSVALGFGCDFALHRAGCSAVVEMFQTEIGLEQRAQQGDPLRAIWDREVRRDTLPVAPLPEGNGQERIDHFDGLVARLAARGKTCAFVDLTRPGFDAHVVRAIIPGLWSDKPRLAGFERLGQPAPPRVLPLLV